MNKSNLKKYPLELRIPIRGLWYAQLTCCWMLLGNPASVMAGNGSTLIDPKPSDPINLCPDKSCIEKIDATP